MDHYRVYSLRWCWVVFKELQYMYYIQPSKMTSSRNSKRMWGNNRRCYTVSRIPAFVLVLTEVRMQIIRLQPCFPSFPILPVHPVSQTFPTSVRYNHDVKSGLKMIWNIRKIQDDKTNFTFWRWIHFPQITFFWRRHMCKAVVWIDLPFFTTHSGITELITYILM